VTTLSVVPRSPAWAARPAVLRNVGFPIRFGLGEPCPQRRLGRGCGIQLVPPVSRKRVDFEVSGNWSIAKIRKKRQSLHGQVRHAAQRRFIAIKLVKTP